MTGQSAPSAESISSSGAIVTFRCRIIPADTADGAGIDFDAHKEGELARASDLAIRAFLHVVNEPFFTVLETSGVGFKLWMISNEFRTVSWWVAFLEGIVKAIGAPRPQTGVVELYPSRDPKKYGRGLRAFGSWNPRNDAVGRDPLR